MASYIIKCTNLSSETGTVVADVGFRYSDNLNDINEAEIKISGSGTLKRGLMEIGTNVQISRNGTLEFEGIIDNIDFLVAGTVVFHASGFEIWLAKENGDYSNSPWSSTASDTIFSDIIAESNYLTAGTVEAGFDTDFRLVESQSLWNGITNLAKKTQQDIQIDYPNKEIDILDHRGSSSSVATFNEDLQINNVRINYAYPLGNHILVYGKSEGSTRITGSAQDASSISTYGRVKRPVTDRSIVSTAEANKLAEAELALTKDPPQIIDFDLINPNENISTGDIITINATDLSNEEVRIVGIERGIRGTKEYTTCQVTNPAFKQFMRRRNKILARLKKDQIDTDTYDTFLEEYSNQTDATFVNGVDFDSGSNLVDFGALDITTTGTITGGIFDIDVISSGASLDMSAQVDATLTTVTGDITIDAGDDLALAGVDQVSLTGADVAIVSLAGNVTITSGGGTVFIDDNISMGGNLDMNQGSITEVPVISNIGGGLSLDISATVDATLTTVTGDITISAADDLALDGADQVSLTGADVAIIALSGDITFTAGSGTINIDDPTLFGGQLDINLQDLVNVDSISTKTNTDLTIQGNAPSTTGTGATININAGAAGTSAGNDDGGDVYVRSGDSAADDAGDINLEPGASTAATGNGGAARISGGDTSGTNRTAGLIALDGGDATAGNSDGGGIFLDSGLGNGSGTDGIVELDSNDSDTDVYCFDFNVFADGSKNCIMPTSIGEVKLAAIESPEVWFEDKLSVYIPYGQTSLEVPLDPLFIEVCTIDSTYPLNVIATPTSQCNNFWIKKFYDKIIIYSNTNSSFDLVISARRKGLEKRRFEVIDPKKKEERLRLKEAKKIEKENSKKNKQKNQ